MAPSSPAVASWELSLRLRERRKQLGTDAKVIADSIGATRSYWGQIETDRRILSEDKLKVLNGMFEFNKTEANELLALRETAKERGWWTRYSALFRDNLLRYYGLEWGAESIRTYESVLIPGLLQSEEFIRALMVSGGATIPAIEANQRVEVRLHRQKRLNEDNPVQLTAVIGEAALLQQTGGPDVLHRQLLHLAHIIETHPDNVDVRVIPFVAANSILAGSTFHLLDFASPRLPTLAWHESAVFGEILTDDPDKKETRVRDLGFVHDRALALALSREESLALIKKTAGRIQSGA